jgi:hypothetical protein
LDSYSDKKQSGASGCVPPAEVALYYSIECLHVLQPLRVARIVHGRLNAQCFGLANHTL